MGDPGPKPRPAIVLNLAVDPDAGEAEVQLVYGTSKLKLHKRPRDFFVTNVAEMDACGLSLATSFDLDNVAWIPWACQWFDALPGHTSPIIGRLSDHAIRLLQVELSHRRQCHTLSQIG